MHLFIPGFVENWKIKKSTAQCKVEWIVSRWSAPPPPAGCRGCSACAECHVVHQTVCVCVCVCVYEKWKCVCVCVCVWCKPQLGDPRVMETQYLRKRRKYLNCLFLSLSCELSWTYLRRLRGNVVSEGNVRMNIQECSNLKKRLTLSWSLCNLRRGILCRSGNRWETGVFRGVCGPVSLWWAHIKE